VAGLVQTLDRMIDWLAAGIAALVARPARAAGHLVVQRGDLYELHRRRGRSIRPLATGSLQDIAQRLKATADRPVTVELRLEQERFLRRSLELPLQSADHLDAVVALQAERILPWPKGDARYAYSVRGGRAGMLSIDLIAMASDALADIRAKLAALGLKDDGIGVAEAALSTPAQPQFREEDVHRLARGQARHRLLVLAWLSLVCVGSVLGMTAVFDQRAAIAEREARILAGERHLADLRSRAGSQGARSPEEAGPLRLLVVEALSRTLPDHTYLEALSIEGSEVRLEGLSADANGLIGLLEADRFFSAVRHDAGIVREPERGAERFAIAAQLTADAEAAQ
jgi:general secretion pathway protein L